MRVGHLERAGDYRLADVAMRVLRWSEKERKATRGRCRVGRRAAQTTRKRTWAPTVLAVDGGGDSDGDEEGMRRMEAREREKKRAVTATPVRTAKLSWKGLLTQSALAFFMQKQPSVAVCLPGFCWFALLAPTRLADTRLRELATFNFAPAKSLEERARKYCCEFLCDILASKGAFVPCLATTTKQRPRPPAAIRADLLTFLFFFIDQPALASPCSRHHTDEIPSIPRPNISLLEVAQR